MPEFSGFKFQVSSFKFQEQAGSIPETQERET
jgi:hypothetical protein